MQTPKMPGYTCSLIDRLQKQIDDAYSASCNVIDEYDEEFLRSLLLDIQNILCGESFKLEDVRKANIQLRNCAEYWRDEYEKMEANNNL